MVFKFSSQNNEPKIYLFFFAPSQACLSICLVSISFHQMYSHVYLFHMARNLTPNRQDKKFFIRRNAFSFINFYLSLPPIHSVPPVFFRSGWRIAYCSSLLKRTRECGWDKFLWMLSSTAEPENELRKHPWKYKSFCFHSKDARFCFPKNFPIARRLFIDKKPWNLKDFQPRHDGFEKSTL